MKSTKKPVGGLEPSTARKGARVAKLSKADRDALDCERLYQKFRRQPAQLTDEQVEAMERRHTLNVGASGFVRRAGLASLTKSGKELCVMLGKHGSREAVESFAELVNQLRELSAHYKAVSETLASAETRLWMAMAVREDFLPLMQAARNEGEVSHAAH